MDWELIALIAVTVLLLLASGVIRKLIKEVKDLFDVIHIALEDDQITAKELAQIFKEAKDVKDVVFEIALAIARSPRRPSS